MLDKIMVKLTAGGVSQEPAMSAVKTDRRQGGYLYEDCSVKISWTGK